jgi:UDP-N-acetylglucosamine--N-acetylmuramyl-(pentapeptide) pyrophosphoryl-undecaprenol N-acetylglucosamine transferase
VGAKNALPTSTAGYHAENYIQDMATAYLAADIIISRSGAVTCAEVNTLGKFALFIPLPIGNGEQELNARNLISQSRAEVILQKEFTSGWLLTHIERLLHQSQAAPTAGSSLDIEAATKIVALMDHALSGGTK